MFKVTAMKVCIAQAYTNTLVLFYGSLNALSSTCAIKCYLEQIVGKIKKNVYDPITIKMGWGGWKSFFEDVPLVGFMHPVFT